ncbi:MAG TPA: glycosyltransferase [Opitutales bacterium]|nr:glycosyltransferase [Opitutales bacterium]
MPPLQPMASSHSAPLAPDRSAWPRISVVLPNYNHCHFLKISLPALLSQSYPPYEIVVVDDGSKDDSVAYIEAMREKHPLIRLYRHEKNQGVVAALNTGLREISGDAVYLAGADDEVYPGFFEEAARMLAAHPEAGFFCSDGDIFHERDQFLITHRLNLADQPTFFTPEEFLHRIRQLSNFYFESHTILTTRRALAEEGELDPQLGYRSDWFINWVSVARHGCCYSPRTLAKFLDRGTNFSVATAKNIEAEKRVWRNVIAKLRSPAYRDVRPYILDPVQYRGDSRLLENLLAILLINRANWKMLPARLLFAWACQCLRRIRGFWRRNLTPAQIRDDLFNFTRTVFWRSCWITCRLCAHISPARTNFLRISTLTMLGAKVDPECWIDPSAQICRPWKLRLGHQVRIGARVKIFSHSPTFIGDATIVQEAVELLPLPPGENFGSGRAPINIGEHCTIGAYARIFAGSNIPSHTQVPFKAVITGQPTSR